MPSPATIDPPHEVAPGLRVPSFRTAWLGAREKPEALGRLGSLEVRLAADPKEVRRAQRLRYRVFYEEGSAAASRLALLTRRDVDAHETRSATTCSSSTTTRPQSRSGRRSREVVGTYRLLRQEVAAAQGGFYSAGEFDLAPLLAAHPGRRFLELGRSCVLRPYRNRKTVELLWAGIWAYFRRHGMDAMIGCASLEGTDPDALATPLSFLHRHALAPAAWQVAPRPGLVVAMDRLPPDAVDAKAALRDLPPLLKAYLRIGATVGDGAVVDRQFGVTDVFVVIPAEAISARYLTYFGPTANRYAA